MKPTQWSKTMKDKKEKSGCLEWMLRNLPSYGLTSSKEHQTKSTDKWAPSSEFVSSSIPSWQNLTAHAQPFREARDPAFCLKVPLDSLLVWASSEGSGETARMRKLAWTFAARIGDKYQIRLTRPKLCMQNNFSTYSPLISDLHH